MTPYLSSLRRLRPLSAAAALLAAPAAFAQVAPTATDQPPVATPPATATAGPGTNVNPPAGPDATVKLTPFEVQADKDSGYYAPNTLAGTRINSKVEDLGASITVVTKQQLIDTGAVDINDIFKYESNVEGLYDFTPQLSSVPTNDQAQSSPQTAVRVRGLGGPNMAINDFAMTSRIPIDTYDLESVEISRGPNSTLFGLGNPSGAVNLNTLTANVTRNFDSTSARVDSYGGWRTTADFNRMLWRDKLAVRVAYERGNKASERKPSYDETRRLYGTLTFKPFSKTNIRLIWEHFEENRQTPNYLTPRDGVTEWIQDGKPTWNPLTWTATANGQQSVVTQTTNENLTGANSLPLGLFANTTNYTRPSMYIDGGQVALWEINRENTSTNPNNPSTNARMIQGSGSQIMRGITNGGILYQVPGINNKALYDWTKINAVSPDWNYDHATLYTAIVEQELIPDMYVRGAWHLEDSNSYNRNIVNPPTLEVDTNQYLLDGRANPYFLRPFYQVNEPTIFQSPEYNDNLQGEIAYDLNVVKLAGPKWWAKWLGEHRVLGYYESRHITDGTFRYREAILNDPTDVWNVGAALNYTNGPALGRPTYRYYVGPTGAISYNSNYTPPKSGVKGTFPFMYQTLTPTNWTTEQEQFGTTAYVTSQTRQEITSHGAVIQDMFFDDRLVFTGGIRNDYNRTRNSNGATLDSTGYYDYAGIDAWGPWTEARGKTRTMGLVIKPLPWFSIFGDKSDSFLPQAAAIDLFDRNLPNTYGHGQDLGFNLNFFNNKLVLRASTYKTTIENDRNSDSTIGSRILRLEAYTTPSNSSSDRFSLEYWADNAAAAQLGLPAPTSYTALDPNVASLAAQLEQRPAYLTNAINAVDGGANLRGTNNTEAKGAEVEVDYNPSYNLNFKFTGAQTKSILETLENDLTDYLNARLPVWKTIHDASGDYFWTSTKYSSTTAQSFYTTSVNVPIEIDQALLGKSNPQIKEYTFRAFGVYRFTEGWLKGFQLGPTIRWDDKSVIGYLAAAADSDGIVRNLDTNKPVYDPARYAGDFMAAYDTKVYGGRVGMRIQLNWYNVFETGGLRATAVNPDGTVYNWRIIDPQQFVLTTTFTF